MDGAGREGEGAGRRVDLPDKRPRARDHLLDRRGGEELRVQGGDVVKALRALVNA